MGSIKQNCDFIRSKDVLINEICQSKERQGFSCGREQRLFFLAGFAWVPCAEHHTECSLKLPITVLWNQHTLESKAYSLSYPIFRYNFFNLKLLLWTCWHLHDINKLLGIQNPLQKIRTITRAPGLWIFHIEHTIHA